MYYKVYGIYRFRILHRIYFEKLKLFIWTVQAIWGPYPRLFYFREQFVSIKSHNAISIKISFEVVSCHDPDLKSACNIHILISICQILSISRTERLWFQDEWRTSVRGSRELDEWYVLCGSRFVWIGWALIFEMYHLYNDQSKPVN